MTVRRVLAPNPGPMTGPGTNTWLVEDGGECVIVDPGPAIDAHIEAVTEAARGLEAKAVVVTHTHPDHAPAADAVGEALGAPVMGPAAGPGFSPDTLLTDGDRVAFGRLEMIAVATPGHTADSTCYRVRDQLFTGDHIMGGSTVMVEDMSDYMTSLEVLQGKGLTMIYPGHGPVVDDPDAVIAEYLAHRRERESQILSAVNGGSATVGAVVETVYADVDPGLHPAASVSVDAHLRKLAAERKVSYRGSGALWSRPVAPS